MQRVFRKVCVYIALALNGALRAPLFVFCYQKFDIRLLDSSRIEFLYKG